MSHAVPSGRTAAVPPFAPPDQLSPAASAAEPPAPDPRVRFFEWLLDGSLPDLPLSAVEQRQLAGLDARLASASSCAELLPRAPAVISQLLKSLRDADQSGQALAHRVAKDPHLVAEVIRLANSTHARAASPVTDLVEAIARLGTEGLRRVIARVVLTPMFDARSDPLTGRAAPRLWLHSEAKADACMRLAGAAGLDPFEGYLAGLMHNIGWTAALRAMDRSDCAAPAQFTRAFVPAIRLRTERFFATLVLPWQLTPLLTELATESLDVGLAGSHSALARVLMAADQTATLKMLEAQPIR
ncbi:MAG: HDOD domain-containing protein [Burkholderiaceae bacterium]